MEQTYTTRHTYAWYMGSMLYFHWEFWILIKSISFDIIIFFYIAQFTYVYKSLK
jgi:hypothetical protein